MAEENFIKDLLEASFNDVDKAAREGNGSLIVEVIEFVAVAIAGLNPNQAKDISVKFGGIIRNAVETHMNGLYESKLAYTTGEIAKMLECAPRTVAAWCDTGKLGMYKIPGSDHRRIPRGCFVAFCHSEGIPFRYGADFLFLIDATLKKYRLLDVIEAMELTGKQAYVPHVNHNFALTLKFVVVSISREAK